MTTNRDRAAQFRALAADLEDAALRMAIDDDRNTVDDVATTLLGIADDFDGGETNDDEDN